MTKIQTLRVGFGVFVTAALLVGSGVLNAGAAPGPEVEGNSLDELEEWRDREGERYWL